MCPSGDWLQSPGAGGASLNSNGSSTAWLQRGFQPTSGSQVLAYSRVVTSFALDHSWTELEPGNPDCERENQNEAACKPGFRNS